MPLFFLHFATQPNPRDMFQGIMRYCGISAASFATCLFWSAWIHELRLDLVGPLRECWVYHTVWHDTLRFNVLSPTSRFVDVLGRFAMSHTAIDYRHTSKTQRVKWKSRKLHKASVTISIARRLWISHSSSLPDVKIGLLPSQLAEYIKTNFGFQNLQNTLPLLTTIFLQKNNYIII